MRRSDVRRRRLLALAVLTLHGALFWALRPAPREARPVTAPAVTWLRLLPEPRPAAPATAPQSPATTRPAPRIAPPPEPRPAPPPAAPPPAAVPEPQAITPPPATPPPPLILALPPAAPGSAPGWREQLLRDPRANSRPARAATEALQSLAGDGRRHEETLAGEGRRRVRIDGACVEVHQARMAQLDPHNQSSNPLPAQVRSCD